MDFVVEGWVAAGAVGDDEDAVGVGGFVEGGCWGFAELREFGEDFGGEGGCFGWAEGVVFVEDEGADCWYALLVGFFWGSGWLVLFADEVWA